MNKGILAIVALVLVAGVAYFATSSTSKDKNNAQLVSAKELQDALNKQLAALIPQDHELRLDGSFTCDAKLVCKAQKLAIIDTVGQSNTELASLQNLTLGYTITHKSYDSTISGDVHYGQALLEQMEFVNPGIIEALTPLLPNQFSCTTSGTLDSAQGIETSWGDCTINAPSADWNIAGNMDIGFDAFKNITMPELILDKDGKLSNLDELTEDKFNSFQLGLRKATIELTSRNFSDALFELIRLKEPNLARSELALGVDMAIAMGIMAMRTSEIDEEDTRTSEQFAQALENLKVGLRGLLASNSDITNISIALQAKEPQKIPLYSPAMLEMGSVFEFLRHYNLESSYK